MNKQAACAGDISALVEALLAMATAGSSVSLLCAPELLEIDHNRSAVPPLRRLQNSQGISLGKNSRLTSCIFDAVGAAVAFAHFGLDSEQAHRRCPWSAKLRGTKGARIFEE